MNAISNSHYHFGTDAYGDDCMYFATRLDACEGLADFLDGMSDDAKHGIYPTACAYSDRPALPERYSIMAARVRLTSSDSGQDEWTVDGENVCVDECADTSCIR